MKWSHATALITAEDVDVMDGLCGSGSLREVYAYDEGWGELGARLQEEPRISGWKPSPSRRNGSTTGARRPAR